MSSPDHNDYDLDQHDHGDDPREDQQSEDDSAEDALEAESRSKPDYDDPTEENDLRMQSYDDDHYNLMGE